eukprot:2161488-Pleurochrysis_carterae.AAC.4
MTWHPHMGQSAARFKWCTAQRLATRQHRQPCGPRRTAGNAPAVISRARRLHASSVADIT